MSEQSEQAPILVSVLTPEDSKRVADALIEAIEGADLSVGGAVYGALTSFLSGKDHDWKPDWLQLRFSSMCERIECSVEGAAYQAAQRGSWPGAGT